MVINQDCYCGDVLAAGATTFAWKDAEWLSHSSSWLLCCVYYVNVVNPSSSSSCMMFSSFNISSRRSAELFDGSWTLSYFCAAFPWAVLVDTKLVKLSDASSPGDADLFFGLFIYLWFSITWAFSSVFDSSSLFESLLNSYFIFTSSNFFSSCRV